MKKINCPVCSAEYLPAELFYPTDIIGNPTKISKEDGKIMYYKDTEENLCQTYICDNCSNKFSVTADLKFSVEEIQSEFSKNYHRTQFNKPQLTMEE